MNVFDAINKRRSIRRYIEKPVEDEKLLRLLQAARLAPSAKNRQNWEFIVIRNKEIKEALVPVCYGQRFISKAPVVIAGVADPKLRWYKLDMGIAFEHIALEAVELGLGTCWIGAFDEKKVSRILNLPNNLETVILMTVGYPQEIPPPTPRKKLDEITHYELYQVS
ncbi:MAG: nitroreductase [Thermoplasmata archaeon]|nr:MAG: nitroreductase [Thermoplasmata archaeon]RLF35096.1 MAG: nitroreductase [Thermoplasmata archaeon]